MKDIEIISAIRHWREEGVGLWELAEITHQALGTAQSKLLAVYLEGIAFGNQDETKTPV